MKAAAILHHVSSLLLAGRLTGKPLHVVAIPVQPQTVVWRQIHKAQRVGEDPLPRPPLSSLLHRGNFMSCPDLLLNINNFNYILWKQMCLADEGFVASPILRVCLFPVTYLHYRGLSQLLSEFKPSFRRTSLLTCDFLLSVSFLLWMAGTLRSPEKNEIVWEDGAPCPRVPQLRRISSPPPRKPVHNSFLFIYLGQPSVVLANFTCLILCLSILAHPCWQACMSGLHSLLYRKYLYE